MAADHDKFVLKERQKLQQQAKARQQHDEMRCHTISHDRRSPNHPSGITLNPLASMRHPLAWHLVETAKGLKPPLGRVYPGPLHWDERGKTANADRFGRKPVHYRCWYTGRLAITVRGSHRANPSLADGRECRRARGTADAGGGARVRGGGALRQRGERPRARVGCWRRPGAAPARRMCRRMPTG